MQPLDLVIRRVAERCEALGLAYFITGSVASMAWGEVRFTQDVDIAVTLPSEMHETSEEFCAGFLPPDWHADPLAACAAAHGDGQFSITYVPCALKADIMIFRDTPYNDSRLHRRRLVELPGGGSAYFAAPEDVILKKLEAFRDGGSDKHLRDITGIVRVSGDELDYSYLELWVLRNRVQHEWQAIKSRLGMA